MAKTIRIDESVYETLQTEARAQGVSIAQIASTRLDANQPQQETSDAVASGMPFTGGEQPLQVTLIDRRQDARIDQLEEQVKQVTAGVISNRLGILHIAEDDADEVNGIMTGAYNKLMQLGFTDVAKEVQKLNQVSRDVDLDEDNPEYYEDPEDDEDDEDE